jgi:ATP-dependent DNA helicase RecG
MTLTEFIVEDAVLAMPKAALTRPLPRGKEREIGYAVGHGVAFAGLRRAKHSLVSSEPAAERVALALAASEGTVNHARLRAVTAEHPVDLSKTLQHLTQAGLLESTGGRGAVYHLSGEAIPTPDDVFGTPNRITTHSSSNLDASSSNLDVSSSNLDVSFSNLDNTRNEEGCLLSEQLALPVMDDLNVLSVDLRRKLEALAAEPRAKGKVDRAALVAVILRLCEGRYVTLRSLAELVHRKPETLRNQYLSQLVRERRLMLAFPKTPTHERQAYTTTTTATP